MNKAGGIAYLLKHGRAPLPAITRTEQPRRGNTSVRGYASGGSANAPLNYENVPNYEYTPAASTVAPHYELGPDGKLVFVPGTYSSGIYGSGARPSAATAAPASAATAQQQQYVNDGRDHPGAEGGGFRSESPLAGPSKTGTFTGDLTLALDAYGNALGGWLPLAFAARAVSQSMLPSETIKAAKAARDALKAEQDKDPFFGGGGYEGPGGRTSATGAGIASNPMGVDPATAQGQRSDGSDGRAPQGPADGGGSAGPLSGGAFGEGRGSPGEGNQGGGYTGAGNDRDAVGGWYKNGRFNQPAYATGGITALAGGGHTQGPRLLSGGGDGLSDGIPAVIGRNQPARLADGEFVVSADVVSALGGGSTKAGAKKLYDMMDRIRKQAHGTTKQVKKVSERKVLPA